MCVCHYSLTSTQMVMCTCAMTYLYVCCDSFVYVRYDLFVCVPCPNQVDTDGDVHESHEVFVYVP